MPLIYGCLRANEVHTTRNKGLFWWATVCYTRSVGLSVNGCVCIQYMRGARERERQRKLRAEVGPTIGISFKPIHICSGDGRVDSCGQTMIKVSRCLQMTL